MQILKLEGCTCCALLEHQDMLINVPAAVNALRNCLLITSLTMSYYIHKMNSPALTMPYDVPFPPTSAAIDLPLEVASNDSSRPEYDLG